MAAAHRNDIPLILRASLVAALVTWWAAVLPPLGTKAISAVPHAGGSLAPVSATPPAANPSELQTEKQADFYVAPNGNDSWPGRLAAPNQQGTDGPFATLGRARAAIRELKARAKQVRPLRVLIRGGTYRLSEPLRFAPLDSGSPEAPISYEAYPGETPIFSGGVPITGWSKVDGGLWTARVFDVEAQPSYFRQLFVDGQRRSRARTPNEGTFHTAGPLNAWTDHTAARRDPETKMGFRYRKGDLQLWKRMDDAMLVVFHSWTASRHHVAALEPKEQTVRFTAPSGWPIGYWEREQRYYVENVPESLDAPGEWYLDRSSGLLSYYPLPGEDPANAAAVAPRLRELLVLEGKPEDEQWVHDLRFVGLSFQHADWDLGRSESCDGQAAAFLQTAAVHATGARRCVFQGCEVAHVGDYAVWFDRGCQNNRIQQCHLHDLGAGGVRLGEPSLPEQAEQRAQRNAVVNCFIHAAGRVYPAGVGVWIGKSSYNNVSHNEISDLFYTGVSVGWSWGYAPSSAHDNLVEHNHIHHIGQGVLSDMGGIYTLGLSPGSRLASNLIHDVFSYSYGGWGIYPDEGTTGLAIENNVVYRTKTGGFHQHYGRENVVRNNVFALAVEHQVQRTREEAHRSFTFERNIVYFTEGGLFAGRWGDGHYVLDHNLYWNASGAPVVFPGDRTLVQWQQTGQDEHSAVADPRFVNPDEGDFHLRPDSPAWKLGFEPIDLSDVGLTGPPEWTQLPQHVRETQQRK